MARVVTCGFEVGSQRATGSGQPRALGYTNAWTDGISDFTTGGNAIGGPGRGDGAGWWSNYSCHIEDGYELGWDLGASRTEVYGSFYFLNNTSLSSGRIFSFGRSPVGLYQFNLRLASGAIAISRGSSTTVLATGPILAANVWYQVEFRYLCDQTTGRCVVKVDGDTKIDYTGDTAAESTADFRYLWLDGDCSGTVAFDDVIINDTTGATNVGWVGDEVVVGLRLNGSGDSNQLDPGRGDATQTTFQRVYIGSDREDAPDISPAPDALWNRIDSYVKRNLLLDVNIKVGISHDHEVYDKVGGAYAVGTGVQYDDILLCQAISPPLAAQTLSPASAWTFKGYWRCDEDLSSADARSQIVIRVVSADGATVRGTLYAGDTGTGAVTQEWVASSSSLRSASFPRSVPATVSALTINAGDRLVLELGYRIHSASNDTAAIHIGCLDLDAYPDDIAENESDTGNGRGWLEFSSAITLAASSTDNYRFVNWPVAFGAASLLRSATVDEFDLYGIEDSPAIASTVSAVTVYAVVRKTQPGTREVALPVKRGGTQSDGSDISVPLSWRRVRRTMDTDPTDSGAWSTGDVDALQIGVKVRS